MDGEQPILTVPHDAGDREAALERQCRHLQRRLSEQSRTLSEVAQELGAEIVRREEAQAALMQAQKLEALGHLTSGIVHDFNNALNGIMMSYDLLAKGIGDPRQRVFVEHGQHAAERALDLTRRLLAFARREDPLPQRCEPATLLAGLKVMVDLVLRGEVHCAFEVEDGVWPVLLDGRELETVLLNLAVNARDAMPDGGQLRIAARNAPQGQTGVAALVPGDYVVFSVSDTGTGMPPEVVARATEAFFTTKGPDHGTGLGLAMANAFATRSGGALRIESAVGEGTRIDVFLPRAVEETPDAVEWAAPRQPGSVLLLCDENAVTRKLAAGKLRALGYQVLEAANAQVALAISYNVPVIDLAIVSATLPGGDGAGLAERLRVERPKLPVLFLVDAHDTGGRFSPAALLRPYSVAGLCAAVSDCLADRPSFEDRETALSARLMERLRHPMLRPPYVEWRRLRGADLLPRVDDVDALTGAQRAHHFLAAVEDAGGQPRFRLLSVGAALSAVLGRSLEGDDVSASASDVIGSLSAAYAQAFRSRLPVYDWLRQTFGDGPPVRFDRLILPLSDDGQSLSHLLGIVLFDNFPSDLKD